MLTFLKQYLNFLHDLHIYIYIYIYIQRKTETENWTETETERIWARTIETSIWEFPSGFKDYFGTQRQMVSNFWPPGSTLSSILLFWWRIFSRLVISSSITIHKYLTECSWTDCRRHFGDPLKNVKIEIGKVQQGKKKKRKENLPLLKLMQPNLVTAWPRMFQNWNYPLNSILRHRTRKERENGYTSGNKWQRLWRKCFHIYIYMLYYEKKMMWSVNC